MELVQKCKYSIKDLLNVVNILRSPKGCPWDRVQTHSSIRLRLIEESYEAIEAIDMSNSDMLREELGDILLQLAFHCSIEEENDNFSFDDIVDQVCRKTILRHPHVFSGMYFEKDSDPKVYEMKIREKPYVMKVRPRNETPAESVKNISRMLPALMRTEKMQAKTAKAGYGFFSVEDALNETFDSLHCLETLILNGRRDDYEKELGDLLFSVTEVARLINVDAESALYDSCERFKDEFLYKISLENKNKV